MFLITSAKEVMLLPMFIDCLLGLVGWLVVCSVGWLVGGLVGCLAG